MRVFVVISSIEELHFSLYELKHVCDCLVYYYYMQMKRSCEDDL